ncbi:TonB C-terminal domain-containing protein [Dechloromonas sp. HYN0024]|uniref:TonB C-terminal domain-containing protein n=1 Tax=Dechloromonas sp. HYN0024 TaxID=2231055 RepID=UPI000E44DDBE|nr:TonB C-terminal domain-containing protein [Dechloromonas sp. HYN0024]AXS80129.1 TonB-dependent receptor [Dechloromonas sp. HYN0024]
MSQHENEEKADRRKLIIMAVVVVVIVALVGWGLYGMFGGKSATTKKPPKISLIPNTPPPPPPPPPKEEKRPEPPKEQKEVKMNEDKKEQPPADPSLKMEGAAGDGPSMFAAGKVTSEDLSRVGAGTGGGLVNPFNTYAMSIKGELQRHLAKRPELKRRQYKVDLLLWVADDGRLKHYELVGSSKDDETDESIRAVLATFATFSEPPPAKMPLPIKLRIVASGRG